MPIYLYLCDNCRQETESVYPMGDAPAAQECLRCSMGTAHRKYTVPGINWGGLAPSAGQLDPKIRQLIDSAPERRDKYLAKKAARKES